MKSPAPSARQMVEFLAISFIAAISLVPAVRAAPSPRSVRRFPTTTTATATAISQPQPPSARETPQDSQPLPLYKQEEEQMWEEVRRSQEQRGDPYTWNPNFPPRNPRLLIPQPWHGTPASLAESIFGKAGTSTSATASASSDLGPSPTTTTTRTPPLRKRGAVDINKSEHEEEKGNIFWPKDSVDKISTWLKGQKNKILSQVDKIRSKGNTAHTGNQGMNPLPLGNIIGSGRNDDDYEELPRPVPDPVPVKLETTFQHPENATQAERFRNVLLLEAPTQVRPGVKLNVDFSNVRSTINGVSGAEYYENVYGNGYGYSYGSLAAGVFAITVLWMFVRRRPGMFGSGFPCSRPGWVGSLVERWRRRKGVGGLEGGQVEEIRRGRALLRED